MNTLAVKGTTRLYLIVGDPIVQVRSPETFTDRFQRAGFDAMLLPAHVPEAQFDDIVPALIRLANLDGLIATVPFKSRAFGFAHRVGDAARCIGAVNALRREADGTWTGDMFDGVGFVRGAESKGARLRGRCIALFGAGGAGSAIAHALAVAGAASIALIDPLRDRAKGLAERLQAAVPACRFTAADRIPPAIDMLVNASPIGMRAGDAMPADVGPLNPGVLVGDVVIADAPTPLIRHAMACGCEFVDGRAMLGGQVDAIVAFFTPRLQAMASGRPGGADLKEHGAHSR